MEMSKGFELGPYVMSNKKVYRQARLYIFHMIFVVVALMLSMPVIAASFDCSKAGTNVEKMICEDELLSKQDEVLATTYTAALEKAPDIQTLKQQQPCRVGTAHQINVELSS